MILRSSTVLLALLAGAVAQDDATRAERDAARAAAYAELLLALDAEPVPPVQRRQKLLHDFLTEFASAPSSAEVLGAQLRLGGLALQRLDALTALKELDDVAVRAAATEPELRARALFGLHQAHLLAGEPLRAREALELILREHEDDAAAQGAKVALAQLEDRIAPAVGKPMPRLAFGVDLDDRKIEAKTFAAGPKLYVFWSMAHEPSQRRLEACARVWRKLGLPDRNLVAYAVDDDVGALRRLARSRNWTFRVLPAGAEGFLHSDWLHLGIQAVPTTMLVGLDDVLCATDLPPDRLEAVLRGN